MQGGSYEELKWSFRQLFLYFPTNIPQSEVCISAEIWQITVSSSSHLWPFYSLWLASGQVWTLTENAKLMVKQPQFNRLWLIIHPWRVTSPFALTLNLEPWRFLAVGEIGAPEKITTLCRYYKIISVEQIKLFRQSVAGFTCVYSDWTFPCCVPGLANSFEGSLCEPWHAVMDSRPAGEKARYAHRSPLHLHVWTPDC